MASRIEEALITGVNQNINIPSESVPPYEKHSLSLKTFHFSCLFAYTIKEQVIISLSSKNVIVNFKRITRDACCGGVGVPPTAPVLTLRSAIFTVSFH